MSVRSGQGWVLGLNIPPDLLVLGNHWPKRALASLFPTLPPPSAWAACFVLWVGRRKKQSSYLPDSDPSKVPAFGDVVVKIAPSGVVQTVGV